jgi:hypothetical protein
MLHMSLFTQYEMTVCEDEDEGVHDLRLVSKKMPMRNEYFLDNIDDHLSFYLGKAITASYTSRLDRYLMSEKNHLCPLWTSTNGRREISDIHQETMREKSLSESARQFAANERVHSLQMKPFSGDLDSLNRHSSLIRLSLIMN